MSAAANSTPPPPVRDDAVDLASVESAYEAAVANLGRHQEDNGAFGGEVVWNIMLAAQYVIMCHIVGHPISARRRRTFRKALQAQVRPDGGWGMHPDSESWLFHTVLGYVALRLLGFDSEDPLVSRSLAWIRDHDGPYRLPAWGRIWLAFLGLYPWDGVQPIVPELWLLPASSPFHPSRLYCHMRLIYLGLSHAYGTRATAPSDAKIEAIRSELYPQGYDEAAFVPHRDHVASTDLYENPGPTLRRVFSAVRRAERFSPAALRRHALDVAWDHMRFEFESTGYVCLSPVNGMLFCLAAHHRGEADLDRMLEGIEYWVWEDEDEGLRIAGARSDIWDTAFVLKLLCEGPDSPAASEIVGRAAHWLPIAQQQEDVDGGADHFRAPARGGWGFADENHPWPVSDCTAEALEGLLAAEHHGWSADADHLNVARKTAALEFILLRQNDDGGFGSYERRRGPMLLKRFNPAEIYGNCMLEYSYTECTASCLMGLVAGRDALAERLSADLHRRITVAIDKGTEVLLGSQDRGGGWPGFWGINFTYGTYFAVSGLLATGLDREHVSIRRAVRYLKSRQRSDGGWGESCEGSLHGTDVALPDSETSLVVQTAWAVLTLLEAAPERAGDSIERGIAFLLERQSEGGGWPTERATGVFFNTAVLEYRLYKELFPAWALARYLSKRTRRGEPQRS